MSRFCACALPICVVVLLQVLLSLRPFVADLGEAASRSASESDPAGVLEALQQLARAMAAANRCVSKLQHR